MPSFVFSLKNIVKKAAYMFVQDSLRQDLKFQSMHSNVTVHITFCMSVVCHVFIPFHFHT